MNRINLEMFIKAELGRSMAWEAVLTASDTKLDALALLYSVFEDELAFWAEPSVREEARAMVVKRAEQFETYGRKRSKGRNRE